MNKELQNAMKLFMGKLKDLKKRIMQRGMMLDTLAYWIIAAAILLIFLFFITVGREKGGEGISFVKDLFRFWRA